MKPVKLVCKIEAQTVESTLELAFQAIKKQLESSELTLRQSQSFELCLTINPILS